MVLGQWIDEELAKRVREEGSEGGANEVGKVQNYWNRVDLVTRGHMANSS